MKLRIRVIISYTEELHFIKFTHHVFLGFEHLVGLFLALIIPIQERVNLMKEPKYRCTT